MPGPLTTMVNKILVIHNPNPQPVAFKVKTTAPKQASEWTGSADGSTACDPTLAGSILEARSRLQVSA